MQPLLERGADRALDLRGDLRVVEPVFGLALELRLEHVDAEQGDQALAERAHAFEAGRVGGQRVQLVGMRLDANKLNKLLQKKLATNQKKRTDLLAKKEKAEKLGFKRKSKATD